MNLTKLNNLIPENTFLWYWIKAEGYHTMPRLCDLWSGIYVLSSFLAHKVTFRDIYEDVMPNLMMFLLHGNDIDTGKLLVRVASIINRYKDSTALYINGRSDIMSIVNELDKLKQNNKPNTLLCTSTSIGAFFGTAKGFCYYQDLYNNPTERIGFNGRIKYKFGPVFIHSLSCGTLEEYIETVIGSSESDWTTGSNILVPISNVKKRCDDWMHNGFNPCYNNLANEEAKEICKKKPYTLTFEYEASKFLNRFVAKQRCTDDRFRAFFANRRIFTTKLAGILAVNRRAEQIEIQDVKNAGILLQDLIKEVKVYIKNVTNNTYLDELDRVILSIQKILLHQGDSGIKHSELWQRVRQKTDVNTYKSIMSIMHELGIIDKYIMKRGKAVLYMRNVNTQTLDCNKIVKKYRELNNA